MKLSNFTVTTGKVYSLITVPVRHPVVTALVMIVLAIIAGTQATDLFHRAQLAYESFVTSSPRISSELARQNAQLEEANRRTAEALAATEAARVDLRRRLAEQENARAEADARARELELRQRQAEAQIQALQHQVELGRQAQQRALEEERRRTDAQARQRNDDRNAYCHRCCQARAPGAAPTANPQNAVAACLSECSSGRPSNWFGQGAILCRASTD